MSNILNIMMNWLKTSFWLNKNNFTYQYPPKVVPRTYQTIYIMTSKGTICKINIMKKCKQNVMSKNLSMTMYTSKKPTQLNRK